MPKAAVVRIPSELREFAKLHAEVEGVIQHVGRRTWDLLLIDVQGDWVRGEFGSRAAAEEVCGVLGIRVHAGWDDPRLARRMNRGDAWTTPGGRRRAL